MNIILILISVILFKTVAVQNDDSILLNADIMKTESRWSIVNDGVMGGLSSSTAFIKDDKIIFSGNVSLKNNGGFASLRSPVKNYNFANYSGVEIKIKGDGKRYTISMKETAYFSGYFYTGSFETKKDDRIIVQIPFDEFKLYYFGNETISDKKIPLNNIKEISLLIGDKQEGNFTTEVDYIKLY